MIYATFLVALHCCTCFVKHGTIPDLCLTLRHPPRHLHVRRYTRSLHDCGKPLFQLIVVVNGVAFVSIWFEGVVEIMNVHLFFPAHGKGFAMLMLGDIVSTQQMRPFHKVCLMMSGNEMLGKR